MRLSHTFINKIPSIDELMLDPEGNVITSIRSFCVSATSLAEKYKDRITPENFKGNCLEVFSEFMIRYNGNDNRIGIYDYSVVPSTEDFGVDGHGVGENSNPATVQVKFRQPHYVLTANEDHLTNFLAQSWGTFGVNIQDTKNMLIVTTALKVCEHTKQNMLQGKVRVLNRDALSSMFDDRKEWWEHFYASLNDSRATKVGLRNPLVLRDHQKEAVESSYNITKGKFILPTGTGKTLIEADIVRHEINRLQNSGVQSPVIKINASRILLCFQLFEEIFNRLVDFGIEAKYINFNSGHSDDTEMAKILHQEGMVYRELESTTSSNVVKDSYHKCVNEGIPLIIISTYHSAEKFSESDIVPDLTINDEAHNAVSKNFSAVAKLPTNKNFFFTATEKITECDEDNGMNNVNIFGDYAYKKSAADIISVGEMVAPWVHIVRSTKSDLHIDRDYRKMTVSILEAFDRHQLKIREVSFSPDKIGAKVLVVCRDQNDLINMLTKENILKMKESHPDIKIYGLSSEYGICNNGEIEDGIVTNKKKYKMIKNIKALGDNEKAIIFHVSMIGEGIDVPGITGIMPFRNCELSSLIQNIGRSTRLHVEDRKRLYNDEISVDDRINGKWIKPYCWIIIPSFMIDSEGLEGRIRNISRQLRSEYGFIPQQEVVIDNNSGLPEDEEIDTVNPMDSIGNGKADKFDGVRHEFEKVSSIQRILIEEATYELKDEIVKRILGDILNHKKEPEMVCDTVSYTNEKINCNSVESSKIYINEITGEEWQSKGRGRPPKWVSEMKKEESNE